MGLDERLGEHYGTIIPQKIQVLERATRNDDGSIHFIPVNLNVATIPQQRNETTRTPPTMTQKETKQQPHHRLPLQMITSEVARRADDGVPASLPLQQECKRVSTLENLFMHPPNLTSKQGRLDVLTHPKYVGKPHKQQKSVNKMLEHNIAVGGKQIIGEMRTYYSALYDHQNERDPQMTSMLHSFNEEPLSIEPKRSTGFSNIISRNMPPVTNTDRPTVKYSKLTSLPKDKENSGIVDSHTQNKFTDCKNVESYTSYKPLSMISSWCNEIEGEASILQNKYSNLSRNVLEYSPNKKRAKPHSSQLFERYATRTPKSPITEVDTTFSSSKLSTKPENKKELEKRNIFQWGPKFQSTNNNMSDRNFDIFMKEQSILCYGENALCEDELTQMSGQSNSGRKTNQMITNFNYQITEFRVSLVPEDEEEINQGSVEEFDTESVLSDTSSEQ